MKNRKQLWSHNNNHIHISWNKTLIWKQDKLLNLRQATRGQGLVVEQGSKELLLIREQNLLMSLFPLQLLTTINVISTT